MKKKLLVILFLLLGTENLFCQSKNSIIITVGDHPITTLDLIKEMKLVTIMSNIKLNDENKDNIKNLAIQSLVKRAIKKNEIDRLKITRFNSKDLQNQISSIANNLGLDEDGLKTLLKEQNLKYEDVVKNFEIDLKWNTAIFKLYKNKISLNTVEIENRINLELEKEKSEKFLNLSEIQVNFADEGFETTAKRILLNIKEEGFENTARMFSISGSSAKGGNIGWISENKLSKTIYLETTRLKNGEVSKPIKIDNTLVIIKKIDEKIKSIDLETIKKNIVNSEKMKKLEMFSNSHYSDLEKKIKVRFL